MAAREVQVSDASGVAQNEALRKLVHIAFGFVAYSLRWLTWEQAVALAVAAIIFNALVLPRVGGKLIARERSGRDIGILLYPLAVLVLVLLFRGPNVHIAAVAWCVLAFGDGCATLVGRNFGRRKWPWNRDKSVMGTIAFVEAALPAAYVAALLMPPKLTPFPIFFVVAFAVLVAAVVETLPTRIDDNLTVPFSTAIALIWIERWEGFAPADLQRDWQTWLAINAGLATIGLLARSVSVSGWIGGMALGAVIILFAGWPLYVVLLTFFFLGSIATKLGYGAKRARGLAQEKGGRRGFSHAFANVGFAALCAFSVPLTLFHPGVLWFLAIGALATAAGDTVSSEVGQWLGRRTYLPLTFRRVAPGTEGAVSLEGTIAGVLASLCVAIVGVASLAWRNGREIVSGEQGWELLWSGAGTSMFWSGVGAIVAGAWIGSYAESIIGSLNSGAARPIPNGVLNFLNTAIGAVAATILAAILGLRT